MRICVVSTSAAVLLGEGSGGAERQLALLCRHLARERHEVAMVVPGYAGQRMIVDGVHLFPGWPSGGGVRMVRAFSHRLPNFRRLLKGLAADCYYTMGVNHYASSMVSVARRRGAVSVVALASDRDLFHDAGQYGLALGMGWLDVPVGYLAHWRFEKAALRAASFIATQNDEQSRSCYEMGLRSALIPSIVEPPPPELSALPEDFDGIWVGNVCGDSRRSKGVGELLALAEAHPRLSFAVVGALTSSAITSQVEQLGRLPNVALLGALPHHEVLGLISRSKTTLNTSPSEGFSNVTLEGWSLGKPAVTLTVDPSRLLTDRGLGVCAGGDLALMGATLLALADDDDRRRAMGEECRAFVREENAPEHVCRLLEMQIRRHTRVPGLGPTGSRA